MATDVGLWSPFEPGWSRNRVVLGLRAPDESLKFETSPKAPVDNWEAHTGKGSCC